MKQHLAKALALLLLVMIHAGNVRAEEELIISTEEETAVETATPAPAPVEPTAVPTLVPTEAPTPIPTVPAAPKAEEKTAAPVETAQELKDSGELVRDPEQAHLGVLKHPILRVAGDAFYAQGLNREPATGFGLSLRIEGQFFTWLAIGSYYDFSLYSGGGQSPVMGIWGLMGRIIPVRQEKLSLYLIGGLGLNSLVGANKPRWPGNYHGFAGVGALVAIQPKWDLDLSVVYNYFSPQKDPLSSVSPRIGVSYELDL